MLQDSTHKAASASLMRQLNRSAILDLVRNQSPISRTEISRALKISLPTVMRVVDELFAADLVRWSGDSQVSGGRPRSLLEFNGKSYAVVAVDLSGSRFYGALADLSGSIQYEKEQTFKARNPRDSLNSLFTLIEDLLHASRPPGQQIYGIGVAAPGVTLAEKGIVTWAPNLGWRDLPIRQLLSDRFQIPVVVENDVNLAALGEYGFGASHGSGSAVTINLGTGIGMGVIIDGKIYRGANQSAGEIGYLLPDRSCLGRQFSEFGALESLASSTGIEQRARQALLRLGKNPPTHATEVNEVLSAYRAGESWACQVFDETVDYLSLAVASVATILDPQVIVLGGSIATFAPLMVISILDRLEGVIPVQPNLVASTLGNHAAVLGSMLLVLDLTTERVAVHKYL